MSAGPSRTDPGPVAHDIDGKGIPVAPQQCAGSAGTYTAAADPALLRHDASGIAIRALGDSGGTESGLSWLSPSPARRS
ncbi:hypothetical protein Sros_4550 [Streptosporangium roseum DSM 43021]|uniref:Uncharacterized protein n=1 Tax=Streptosporangium roseum (strain ATCC 12428 / DSM 43021 / JCM 3005 / KCTC 9067 / NCIMB 10171 / NRRL 2505 / NI 9100) TaxID=479432 RepID=D2B398_STRRD|nr:hypothetical protein Sros_4550 [Streptosporangium roseum DSM 43021]